MTADIYIVKSGGSAAAANALLVYSPVAGRDMKALTLGITLSEGDHIDVLTVGSSMELTFQAFGSEIG